MYLVSRARQLHILDSSSLSFIQALSLQRFLPSPPHSLSLATVFPSSFTSHHFHGFSRPSFIIIPLVFPWPLPTSSPSLPLLITMSIFIASRSLPVSLSPPFFLELVSLNFSSNSSRRWFVMPAVMCLCARLVFCVCGTLCVTQRARREIRKTKQNLQSSGRKVESAQVGSPDFFFFSLTLRDKQQQHSTCTVEQRCYLDVLAGKFALSGQREKEIGYPDSHHVLVAGLIAACLSLVPD